MKIKSLTYLLLLVAASGLLFVSCDRDEGLNVQDIEGYWEYSGTKADVYLVDPVEQEKVEKYVRNRNVENAQSYEFKNDRTYYYYLNNAYPLKGIVKSLDEGQYLMDDERGVKVLSSEDTAIYVVSDLKEEVVRELQIDERKVIRALAVDTFRRSLLVD